MPIEPPRVLIDSSGFAALTNEGDSVAFTFDAHFDQFGLTRVVP